MLVDLVRNTQFLTETFDVLPCCAKSSCSHRTCPPRSGGSSAPSGACRGTPVGSDGRLVNIKDGYLSFECEECDLGLLLGLVL